MLQFLLQAFIESIHMVEDYKKFLIRYKQKYRTAIDPAFLPQKEYDRRIDAITQTINGLIERLQHEASQDSYISSYPIVGAVLIGSYGYGINDYKGLPLVHTLSDINMLLLVTEEPGGIRVDFVDQLQKELTAQGIPSQGEQSIDAFDDIIYDDTNSIASRIRGFAGSSTERYIVVTPYPKVETIFRQKVNEVLKKQKKKRNKILKWRK